MKTESRNEPHRGRSEGGGAFSSRELGLHGGGQLLNPYIRNILYCQTRLWRARARAALYTSAAG